MHHLQYLDWSAAEYSAAFRCPLSGQELGGAAAARLEHALTQLYLGPAAAHIVNSGKTAIDIVLDVFRHRQLNRDEVLISAYVCLSVSETVRAFGLKMVAAAVGDDLNLDPAAVTTAIGSRILAVIAIHMYGNPLRITEIEKLCRRESRHI